MNEPMHSSNETPEMETTSAPALGNIHAKQMMEYAEDAQVHPYPWQNWEAAEVGTNNWRPLTGHPGWTSDRVYRRRPKELFQTEVKIPLPLNQPPTWGSKFYMPVFGYPSHVGTNVWRGTAEQKHLLSLGLLYDNADDTARRAQAMLMVFGEE